jgi:glycosyltransferase involved in cell wall biosynthesis
MTCSMNLAFVIKTMDSRGGGAERVLAQVTSSLVDLGHEVTLISFGKSDEPDFYAIDPRIRRIWLNRGNVHSRTTIGETVARARALNQAIRHLRPDVAVGFMLSAYIPLGLALGLTKIPVVASEHNVFSRYHMREAVMLRATVPFYSRVTMISKAVCDSFPRAMARRAQIVPNPVALLQRRADPVGPEQKMLLNAGRLHPQKDQATLIKAFAAIAGSHPAWKLRILGEGPLRGALEALISELGMGTRIEMPGLAADMTEEYLSAQAFVMSSAYEGFGLATAEALSAGIPAIGFADCAGTNELIVDGWNGLLVMGGDRTAALAEGLDRLMRSPDLRRELGANGPASVQQFAISNVVAIWDQLLAKVAHKLPA